MTLIFYLFLDNLFLRVALFGITAIKNRVPAIHLVYRVTLTSFSGL